MIKTLWDRTVPQRWTLGEAARWAFSCLVAYIVTGLCNGTLSVMQSDSTFLTISMITREALRVLENNLTFAKQARREFDDKFAVEGAKIGTVLNVRKPPRYVGRTGQALQIEDSVETSVPVVLNTQFGVDLQFSSQDLALSIDDFSNRFLTPALATVANKIDYDGMQLYNQIYQTVGTPGTTPNALLTYLQAGIALNNSSAPMDGKRSVVITPLMEGTLVDALKGLFQSASSISEQYTKGMMGHTVGFDFFMDQNCATHTVGALGGTPLVDGAGQTGASLLTKSWTGSVALRLKRGDVFTIGSGTTGVYMVNQQSRASTGTLQQFVVTADAYSTAGGAITIPISPAITPSGAFQNVVASAADGATINVLGAANTVTPQGLAFHADAFTLACADLPLPRGVDMAARMSDKQLGLSVRMIRAYSIQNDQFPTRLDILYGWAVLRPELAVRVAG